MNPKVLVIFCLAVAAAQAAVIRPVLVEEVEEEAPRSGRQGRTLGLMTLGLKGIGAGAKVFGSAATTALGITAAAKPLVIAGLGKYALWRWMNLPGNHIGFSAGYRAPEYNNNQYASNGYQTGSNYASNGYQSSNSFVSNGLTHNNFATNGFNDNSNFFNSGVQLNPSGFEVNAGPVYAYANAQPSSASFQSPSSFSGQSFNAQPDNFNTAQFNGATFDSAQFAPQPAAFETFDSKPQFQTFDSVPATSNFAVGNAANEW